MCGQDLLPVELFHNIKTMGTSPVTGGGIYKLSRYSNVGINKLNS
jgi:hypothetical protein